MHPRAPCKIPDELWNQPVVFFRTSDPAADATGAAGSVDVQMVDASGATGEWIAQGIVPNE
eukprot:12921043-Prorocentrum_lima.AAC.1